jgi:hypothetical protein
VPPAPCEIALAQPARFFADSCKVRARSDETALASTGMLFAAKNHAFWRRATNSPRSGLLKGPKALSAYMTGNLETDGPSSGPIGALSGTLLRSNLSTLSSWKYTIRCRSSGFRQRPFLK